jgi:hypothetical protein
VLPFLAQSRGLHPGLHAPRMKDVSGTIVAHNDAVSA